MCLLWTVSTIGFLLTVLKSKNVFLFSLISGVKNGSVRWPVLSAVLALSWFFPSPATCPTDSAERLPLSLAPLIWDSWDWLEHFLLIIPCIWHYNYSKPLLVLVYIVLLTFSVSYLIILNSVNYCKFSHQFVIYKSLNQNFLLWQCSLRYCTKSLFFYFAATEFVGPRYRVLTSATCSSMFAVGQVTLGGVAWLVEPWRYMIMILHIPCFLIVSYYWLLDESVRWQLSKEKYDEAKTTLENVSRINKKKISEKSMHALMNPPRQPDMSVRTLSFTKNTYFVNISTNFIKHWNLF